MHTFHAGYTLLAPLKRDRAEVASQLLRELGDQPERLPFSASPTTHFVTGAVIPAQRYGEEELPATLLLATSFWGPARAHVDELVRVAGPGLRELFEHCEGFVVGCSDAELARFIAAHRRADTFYSGMQYLTRDDVLRHDALRTAIQGFLDERQQAGGLPADAFAAQREIQRFVEGRADLAWARQSWQPPAGSWWARHWRQVLVMSALAPLLLALLVCSLALIFVHDATLGVVVASGWLAIILPLWAAVALVFGVHDAEQQQRFVAPRPTDERARMLAATQNHPVINEMTIAGPIKEGAWRPIFLRIALWIVARVAEGIPRVRGLRTGINIPTVATARWIAMDRGKRLVFISNFTNAAEPYVRDFIDVRFGAMRINLTFGFGRGYPKTEWVIKRGALEDPSSFIYVVAANQQPTELWYCPYRHLSIDNIKINRKIREGLFTSHQDERQVRAWLELL